MDPLPVRSSPDGTFRFGKIGGPVGHLSKYIAMRGALVLVRDSGQDEEHRRQALFWHNEPVQRYGYLGDVLSYSGLLALGLGSAAVGMVINLLAKLVANALCRVLLAVLIFVLGHLFSIAVNLLRRSYTP